MDAKRISLQELSPNRGSNFVSDGSEFSASKVRTPTTKFEVESIDSSFEFEGSVVVPPVLQKEITPKKRRISIELETHEKASSAAEHDKENISTSNNGGNGIAATGYLFSSTQADKSNSNQSTPVRVKSTTKHTGVNRHTFTPNGTVRMTAEPFSIYEQTITSASNTPVRKPPRTP